MPVSPKDRTRFSVCNMWCCAFHIDLPYRIGDRDHEWIPSHPLSPVHERWEPASPQSTQQDDASSLLSGHPAFMGLEWGLSGDPIQVTAVPERVQWMSHTLAVTHTSSPYPGIKLMQLLHMVLPGWSLFSIDPPSQIRLILSVSSSDKQNLPSVCLEGERKPVSNLFWYTY